MKPEFEIEQIRNFVNKGYTSVSARYVKAALQHYDDLVKNCIKPAVSNSVFCENCQTSNSITEGWCIRCGEKL